MKKFIYSLAIIFFVNTAYGQNVAVNTDGSVAHTSALLDIKSTNKGMLIPRMTTAQRTAIASPATGLLVYDTEANSFWFYNGSAWTNITGSGSGGNGTNWKLTGNSGTTPASDFIGTTDNQSLRFKVNNEHYGLLDSNGSVLWGMHTGMNNTGYSNVAIGANAMYNNTYMSNLVAVGDSALFNNGLGATNQGEGVSNTAIGSKSLFSNTTGHLNTALGYQTLFNNTTGNGNTALGSYALYYNTTGGNNTAAGHWALHNNTTGFRNSAFGQSALASNTTGRYNTAVGDQTLGYNYTGNENTALGFGAMYRNIEGSKNTAVGFDALGWGQYGNYNTGIGHEALNGNEGIYNTATGYSSAPAGNLGSRNNSYGALSLTANSTGNQNTAIGYQSMNANTSGSFNVALGNSALTGNVTGTYNTTVGYNADVTVDSLTNATAIGANAFVNANNKVVIGNSSVTSIGGFVNWSNFSDGRFKQNVKEDVPGLAFINKLRPVTYTLNVDAINDFNSKGLAADKKQQVLNPEKKNEVYTGFMAQEVEQAAKSLNYNFSGIDKPKNESKQTYALRYSDFVVPLVKAIQEQQKMIEDLKKEIEALKKNN
jgi:hypothetical protein